MLTRILLAVFDSEEKKRWLGLLKDEQVNVADVGRKADLWTALKRRDSDLVIMPRSLLDDGISVKTIRELPDAPEVIVITDIENAEERARLLTAGALAVLNYALPDALLRETVTALIDRLHQQDLRHLNANHNVARLSDFVSSSPLMQEFIKLVRRVLAADTPLLLLGETGVGKERLAQAIHAEGPRSTGPFVTVNCGALTETLLESELFGHEEGAFTNATRARRGCFELAHMGTVFLDEIGEMPVQTQVKLLRVLQDRSVQRIGSERTTPLNVRVIASSNRDLQGDIEAKRFRQDLFYRLSVVPLTVPPLRDRPDDIPPLVESYINQFRQRLSSPVGGITPEAMEALLHYHWPGNVRELINVIERAMLLCPEERIRLSDLPATIMGIMPAMNRDRVAAAQPHPVLLAENWLDKTWKDAREHGLNAFEKAYITGLLRATGGRVGEAAKRAEIDPRSLYEKMKRHGLQKMDFRGKRRQRNTDEL